jgi:hypothetical protein
VMAGSVPGRVMNWVARTWWASASRAVTDVRKWVTISTF